MHISKKKQAQRPFLHVRSSVTEERTGVSVLTSFHASQTITAPSWSLVGCIVRRRVLITPP